MFIYKINKKIKKKIKKTGQPPKWLTMYQMNEMPNRAKMDEIPNNAKVCKNDLKINFILNHLNFRNSAHQLDLNVIWFDREIL